MARKIEFARLEKICILSGEIPSFVLFLKFHGMKDTLKINSSELQKNFPSIYKDFFNAHDTVLSGNSILTW